MIWTVFSNPAVPLESARPRGKAALQLVGEKGPVIVPDPKRPTRMREVAQRAAFLLLVVILALAPLLCFMPRARGREPIPDVAAQAAELDARVAALVDRLERLQRAAARIQVAEAQVVAVTSPAAKRRAWAELLDARAAMRVLTMGCTTAERQGARLETVPALFPSVSSVHPKPGAVHKSGRAGRLPESELR